jgi:ABC-type transporter Mla subunit MlaD
MHTPFRRLEKIAGLFIIAALAALGALVLFPGIVSGKYLNLLDLTVRSSEGLGLSSGDKVILEGVQVGEVRRVEFDETGGILIAMKVYAVHRQQIRTGTRALLVPPLVMGSPTVTLLRGEGELLPDGSVLQAETQASPIEGLHRMGESLEGTFERVNARLDQMEGILAGAQKLLDTANSLRPDIVESSASVRRSLDHVEDALEELPEMASRSGALLADARRVLESLKRNFLIRANLPADADEARMLPATWREPFSGK